jgi:hypothetical protein
MATEFETFNLPRIAAGVSGQGAITALNAPIAATEEALNKLASRIGSLTNKSATVRHYVPISSDVSVGTLVYYNKDNGRFEPAIARLLGTPGDQGESVEAPCSRVEGLIITVDSSGVTGTMLCGGYWESKAVAQTCLGVNAVAGTYYLSPFTAGRAVLDTKNHLRQAVLSYYGDGKFNLNLFYLAHDNHFHGSAVLKNSWASATSSAVHATKPVGANWVYIGSADDGFINLGELTAATTAVFYEGILQAPDEDFVVSDGYVWCKLASAPAAGSVTLFNHYPFAYDSPVIRGVESTESSLVVRNRNGLVQLTPNAFISGDVNKNALAVSAISDNVILFTPVITGLIAGPGTTLTDATNGTYIISSSQNIGLPKDAYSMNHNGTAVTSDGIFQYVTFPKGRMASFVMSMPVSDVPAGMTLQAQAWGTVAGVGSSFDVTMYVVPEPMTQGEQQELPTTGTDTSLTFTGSSGKLTYAESAGTVKFTQACTLVAVVTIKNAPSTDIRMMRAGFKLGIVETRSVEQDPPAQVERTMAVTGNQVAGYSVSKYDILYVLDGKLQKCMSSDESSGNLCIGISLANAMVGEDAEFIITGIIQDPVFNFIPGLPVYVGLNGRMTQTDPVASAKYVQKIGMALTSAAVQINIEPAVMTGN